jgi:tetratricopeptide (TPR) repeat protein
LEDGWQPHRSWASQVDRGLSYAEDLHENGILTYALQEYAKVLCGIYTPEGTTNPHQAYARYRMGVCAYHLRKVDAAARQWRRLIADFPDSPWADRANRALAAVATTDALSSEASRAAPPLPEQLASPLVARHHLAAQLVDCELPLVAVKEYLKVMFVLTAGRPNPLQAEACHRLGVAQHLRGRPDLAVAAWNRCAEEYPDTPWAEKARTQIGRARRLGEALSAGRAATEEVGP